MNEPASTTDQPPMPAMSEDFAEIDRKAHEALVPEGWSPSGWAARLVSLADACQGEHPALASRYQNWARHVAFKHGFPMPGTDRPGGRQEKQEGQEGPQSADSLTAPPAGRVSETGKDHPPDRVRERFKNQKPGPQMLLEF